ncbi:hypothetical protein M9458_033293, partial [Cirrhinus mrigala]
MDFIQKSGVKIPNAVVVSGITQEVEQDEQVMDFLKQYGKIDRVLLVEDSQSEFFQNLIVEYSSDSAIEGLEPHLPYTCTARGDSTVLYEVKKLSSAYATKVGSNVTKTYLAELKQLAKLSGKGYSEVLKEMMSQIGEDVEAMQHMTEGSSPTRVETTGLSPFAQGEPQLHPSFPDITPSSKVAIDPVTHTNATRAPSLSLSDVNPPDVQKVIVEHIVRGQDSVHRMQTQARLPHLTMKLIMTHGEHILIKGLRPESPPAAYLQLLDSAFGTVEDGEELFAQFLNTLQDSGEKPSTYLHRLQLVLSRATKRGGVAHEEVDKHLLKQFCRGCWDNTLLSTLQLEQKKSSPPRLSDLLVMIRSEEDRQQAKSSRMKKHIGITKQKAHVQFHGAYVSETEEKNVSSIGDIEDLRKQVAKQNITVFNCGEDGHIAPSCTDPANPRLVAEKKRQLEEKQHHQQHPSDINDEEKTPVKKDKINRPAHKIKAQACSSLQHSKQDSPFRLPNQLIGVKSTAQVTVSGEEVNCLLNSGSQVTTVPESFYKQHLSEQTIKPLHDLGSTNTLDVLFDIYSEADTTNRQPLPHGYKVVFKVIELRRKQASNNHQGVVKMQGKMPQVIPARETVVVEGDEKSIVVEYPSSSPLPGGPLVKAGLVDFPQLRPHKLPVVISNESDHDIVIPAKRIIAEICAHQTILLKEHSVTDQSQNSQNSSETQSSQEPTLNFNFGDSPVPLEWKQRITQQLNNMPEVFAHHDLDFGRTDQVRHHIKLSDETPFKLRARPSHPQDIKAVRRHIKELLDAGVIRESESPFASPIVVVRKKNGQVRLCIDYRRLNLQTIKDAYNLPKLEDTFSALSGSQWFSVLDLKSGYYQIEVEEANKPKTAFVSTGCLKELMERCIADMHLKDALVFLDYVILFSRTLEEHEERLLRVLTRLKEFGLKLSPEKCVFFQTSVRYLGHVVSRDGVRTDPEKISALRTWPVPQTLRELKSFLGFAGYYRRFVKGYSSIVKPLHSLTSGYPPFHKKSKAKPTDTRQKTNQALDARLPASLRGNHPEPYYSSCPSFRRPPEALHTTHRCQYHRARVCNRYPAHKLEFLALKWSVTEKFSDYLYGNHFTVVTDSNPLTYILTSAKLDATSYRWLAALSTFFFKLLYRPGRQNGDADGLSRRPHGMLADDLKSQKERECIQQFTQDHLSDPMNVNVVDHSVVKAICERQFIYSVCPDDKREGGTDCVALVETLTMSPSAVPNSYGQEEQFGSLPTVPHLSEAEIAAKQRADQCIKHVISQIEHGDTPPPTLRNQLPDLPLLLRELNRFELHNDILFRQRQVGSQTTYQLVLPAELRNTVLTSLHNHMGHMGDDQTLDLVRARFYWPKMVKDVERKVRTCGRCVRRKARPEKAAPLVNIRTTRPLKLLCMDYLSLEADKSGTKDILVITDHFTKFAVAIPTPNQKARTVAKCLWENFMVHYGIPEKLHSDQGPDFESRTIKELCQVAGIHKVRTTPYHPRGNPVERFNRTLLDMLGTLQNQDKSCWHDHVRPLVHAYNCTRNEVTGYTPYELMFGRQPRLPVDIAFKLPTPEGQHSSHSEYVQRLKSRLKESYKVAMEKAAKIAHKNKVRYDRHVTVSDLEPGDRVLVRNVRIRGKHKISDKWEPTVHVVVRRAGTLPVYTVRPETGDGPLRILHRDLLLPCGYLPVEENTEPVQKSVPRRPGTCATPAVEEENSSEEEDDALTSLWLSSPVPVVSESPVHPDLSITDVPDTQHAEPPSSCSVEGPVQSQNDNPPNFDNPPEHDTQPDFDNLPDMFQSIPDSPLMIELTSHQSDTEYVLTDKDTPAEQANESTLIQNHSPADDHSDARREQLAVPSAISDTDEEND